MQRAAGSRCTACRRSAPIRRRTASSPCFRGRVTSRSRGNCGKARAPGTGDVLSRRRTRGSGSCPSATRTGFGATSRGRRCASPEGPGRSSAPSRWMRSPSSSTVSCPSARPSSSSGAACSRSGTHVSRAQSRMRSSQASTATQRVRAVSSYRDRFARTAARYAAKQDEHAAELEDNVRSFVLPSGDERALDVGTGSGALALALAPHVEEVVGIDLVPELLALARERAPANAAFVEGDGTALPFADASFDLSGTLRTLHHVRRPELVIAEMARVTRPGGRVLVVDQLAPIDPLDAYAVDAFEQARDPGHQRLLPDTDFRSLFDANRLFLVRERTDDERRPLDAYLDLAGCEGAARERAVALAPEGAGSYRVQLGWYLLDRR